MTLLVDASAIVAIMQGEPEGDRLEDTLVSDPSRLTTGIAVWEASMAVARLLKEGPERGLVEVDRFIKITGLTVVSMGAREADQAIRAQARYGRGSGHPARLNMGDCFAYACARTNNARLLYKGEDFAHTDLA